MADNTNFLLKKSSTNGSDVLFNSILGAYYMKLSIGKYVRPTPFVATKWTPEKGIILPLPSELHDETTVAYDNVNMQAVGDIVNQNFQGLAAKTGLGAAKLVPAALVPDAFSSDFPSEAIGTAIDQATGIAPNPNPTVAFKGPELRSFSYSWLLQPRNVSESNKIQTIINFLKSRHLPVNSIKDQVSILDYPSLCQINFYPWDSGGGNNDWGWSTNSIIRYKKCFIAGVTVDYTPSNVPAFFNGSQLPVAIRLSLTFREIEYMLANDWDPELAGQGNLGSIAERIGGAYREGFVKTKDSIVSAFDQATGFGNKLTDDLTKAQQ